MSSGAVILKEQFSTTTEMGHAKSPNAEEALMLLNENDVPSKMSVEKAARLLLDFGIGKDGSGTVIIRSGALGALFASRGKDYLWIEAYWSNVPEKVVDVTGANKLAF